jgi:hypothetical protein
MRQLRPSFLSLFLLLPVIVLVTGVAATERAVPGKQPGGPLGIMVMDGSPVHDVGELHLHMSNWGMIGSMPGSLLPFASAPSGEWTAGSGIEHVFAGGLWVGALREGVPAVSTAAFQWELRPSQSVIDSVYYSAEGTVGGTRFGWPGADDDNDGATEEDILNGYDDDLDGQVDEDYAAISDQMLARQYTDFEPSAIQAYPQHNPLNILVRERSYQWTEDDFDDFVGIDYEITNVGPDVLEDVYFSFFLDGDVGNRNTPNYWENDVAGYINVPAVCTIYGGVRLDYGYVADSVTGSAIGVLLLDHTIDRTDGFAPGELGWTQFAAFSGSQSYEDGGDPTNDFERYELMSAGAIEPDGTTPRDYRILLSVGPFAELLPESTLSFSIALVGMPAPADYVNPANAALTYRGQWVNRDGDANTGIEGRETRVDGPVSLSDGVVVDACRPPYDQPIAIPLGQTVWINYDCEEEIFFRDACGYGPEQAGLYATGVNGKEHHVRWVLPTDDIPTPVAIQRFDAHRDGSSVKLEWEIWADEVIEGYTLLRSTGSGSPSVLADNLPPAQLVFVDAGVKAGTRYEYQLIARGESGWIAQSQRVSVTMPAAALALRAISPNPFTSETSVSFTLPSRTTVDVVVYDVTGRRVATVFAGDKASGDHTVRWNGVGDDGNLVSAGVYFCRIQAGKESRVRKMVVMR